MRTRAAAAVIGILVLIGLAFLGGQAALGARLIQHLPADGASAGALGPIVLTFNRPMDQASVRAALEIQPDVPGKLVWAGETARFLPSRPFQPGTRYTLRIHAGARTTAGFPLAGESWSFTIRAPEVLYLSPGASAGEVWAADPGGTKRFQLTQTNGKVIDFAPAPSGEEFVYSARNADGGTDLWLADRDGKNARQVAACGAETCAHPAWSPDSQRIAYDRGPAGAAARIWTLDLPATQSSPLFQDPAVHGVDPAWSPDGASLAFYDQGAHGLRLIDIATSAQTLIPTSQEAVPTWTLDGKALVFDEPHLGTENPGNQVMAYDLAARKTVPLLGKEADAPDYGLPAWSADGAWMAVGARELGGTPGRQMLVARGDGSQLVAITSDPQFNAASPRFDPWGSQLVFQGFRLGVGSAQPQVMLWERASGQLRVLAENASLPAWLP